nr:response regulator [Maliibacterium massiliense]
MHHAGHQRRVSTTIQKHSGIVSTILICVLAAVFSIISIWNIRNMERIGYAAIKDPHQTSSAAWELRNDIAELRIRADRLLRYHDADTLLETGSAFESIYAQMQLPLETLEEKYAQTASVVAPLRKNIEDLHTSSLEVIQSARQGDKALTERIITQRLYPICKGASTRLESIIADTVDKTTTYLNQYRLISTTTSVLAIVLALALVFVAAYSQVQVDRRSRDILYREMLFDLLSQNVDDVFFIHNIGQKKLEFVSDNAMRILGVPSHRFMEDASALQPYMSDADIEEISSQCWMDGLNRTLERECRMTNPRTGKETWILVRIYPISSEKKVNRLVVSLSDLTEEKRGRQVLEDALRSAQSANFAKRDFLSRMSHEIRTPLNVVIGMSAIARKALDNPARLEDYLSKIEMSSQHLLCLVNDVLDMSKIENGKLHLVKEPFRLDDFISSLTALIYPQATQKKISFDVKLFDIARTNLVGDALRLNQILLNLLTNALKFTPQGGNITLTVRQFSVKKGMVCMRFAVHDTGCGIQQQDIARLFTPFEQADDTVARNYGGTGLGLAITKNLVSMQKGSIDVYSEVGEGSTFIVELPFDLCDEPEKEFRLPARFERVRALVVDDDEEHCRQSVRMLGRMGVRADMACTSQEAIEKLLCAYKQSEPYDVCLMEAQMPDLNGIAITRWIRSKIGPEQTRIILAAYDWPAIEQEARLAGVNWFVRKPLFAGALFDALAGAFGEKRARPQADKGPEQPDFRGRRILIAEDHALNMEIIVELLGATGVNIDQAANGAVALDMFTAAPVGYYDLILMDVQMPVMDGYEAVRRIRACERADARHIPILAMTANAFREDVTQALQCGMDGHIAKPIDLGILYHTLQQYLQQDVQQMNA